MADANPTEPQPVSSEHTEAQLRQEREELRRIVDLIPQTIIVLKPEGKAIYANRVALEYTGLLSDEVQADDFRDRVFHHEDVQRLREDRPQPPSANSPRRSARFVTRCSGNSPQLDGSAASPASSACGFRAFLRGSRSLQSGADAESAGQPAWCRMSLGEKGRPWCGNPETAPRRLQQIRNRSAGTDRAHFRPPNPGSTVMKRPKRDPAREDRIYNEAIVDARPEEQAMSWYYYLEGKISFPFQARCIAANAVSPLRKGETVEVLRMAVEDACEHDMFVQIRWQGRKVAIPLSQLRALDPDESTNEAISDWHYWATQGYCL